MEVRDVEEALRLVVAEHPQHVGVEAAGGVEEEPRGPQGPQQLHPLNEAQGEVLLVVVERRPTHTHPPGGGGTAGNWAINGAIRLLMGLLDY